MDYDDWRDMRELINGTVERLERASREGAQLTAAAIIVATGGIQAKDAATQAIDLSDALEAERAERERQHREAQKRALEQHRQKNLERQSRLKEIDARLENGDGLDTPACEGAPTLREVLTEERGELIADLYG